MVNRAYLRARRRVYVCRSRLISEIRSQRGMTLLKKETFLTVPAARDCVRAFVYTLPVCACLFCVCHLNVGRDRGGRARPKDGVESRPSVAFSVYRCAPRLADNSGGSQHWCAVGVWNVCL